MSVHAGLLRPGQGMLRVQAERRGGQSSTFLPGHPSLLWEEAQHIGQLRQTWQDLRSPSKLGKPHGVFAGSGGGAGSRREAPLLGNGSLSINPFVLSLSCLSPAPQ